MSLLGVQSGDRFRNLGLPGQGHDPGMMLRVDSTTNTCHLNCTMLWDNGDEPSLATIGLADFAAAFESGLIVKVD